MNVVCNCSFRDLVTLKCYPFLEILNCGAFVFCPSKHPPYCAWGQNTLMSSSRKVHYSSGFNFLIIEVTVDICICRTGAFFFSFFFTAHFGQVSFVYPLLHLHVDEELRGFEDITFMALGNILKMLNSNGNMIFWSGYFKIWKKTNVINSL